MAPQIIKSLHPPVTTGPTKGLNLAAFMESNPHNVSPKKAAYVRAHDGHALSREFVFSASHQLAHSLVNVLKLQPGSRVAIFSLNSTWYPIAIHANLIAGCVSVTLNPAYNIEELVHPLKDSQPEYIFAAAPLLPTVREALQKAGLPAQHPKSGKNTIWILDDSDRLEMGQQGEDDVRVLAGMAKGERLETVRIEEPEKMDAFIGYSSGTSGLPKGVQLTHGNHIWLCQMTHAGRHNELRPEEIALAFLPFQHIFALFHSVIFDLYNGTTSIIMPRFELEPFLKYVQKYKVTRLEVVPPILVLLAKSPMVDNYDLSTIKYMLSGAAPLSADLGNQVEARLNKGGKADVRISQGYGLTETSPSTHAGEAKTYRSHQGSIGKLFPNLEARLVDDGKDVGHSQGEEGVPGELWVRGPSIMKGYLNRPDATADCIDEDGWFHTGDVAICKPGGIFYIVDRLKELIKYKGNQVSAAEMEGILLEHPNVADSAVVGVYVEAEATELPLAFIVPSESYKGSHDDLTKEVRQWVDGRVANHKKLRGGVRVRKEIPKSVSGKILRRVLRDELKAEGQADQKAPKAKL